MVSTSRKGRGGVVSFVTLLLVAACGSDSHGGVAAAGDGGAGGKSASGGSFGTGGVRTGAGGAVGGSGGASGAGGTRNGTGGSDADSGTDASARRDASAGEDSAAPAGDASAGGASGDGGPPGAGGVSGTGGAGGTSSAGPGCVGLSATCGAAHTADCCSSSVLPAGAYDRSGYAAATVSSFRLDTYEITVGRFRGFVSAYSADMIASGAGKNPGDAGDPGWDSAWNANLPADGTALASAVKCSGASQTWTDVPGGNENRPMNCITWYEAFAFCVWDGGRLPTEAEWNYAAAGGGEQRQYPWSNPPSSTAVDCSYANYGGANSPVTACVLPGAGSANDVGSESPKGDGKWGQADLAGNVWEWTLDWYVVPYPSPCADCAERTPSSYRVNRGGSFLGDPTGLLSSDRNTAAPSDRLATGGARCARAP